MVEIIKVETPGQLRQFIQFPFNLYKGNPNWVPPLIADEKFTLDSRKNPAFEFSEAAYWLARKNGKIVGRIAGIISHAYIEKWGNRYARFGWIDFTDDREVSKALLDTVMAWATAQGLNGLHGPLGFCDLDKEGMLTDGFDQMGTFITIYNHPYYKDHLEALGFLKDAEWMEWEIKLSDLSQAEHVKKLADRAKVKYDMHMVPLKKNKDVVPYISDIFDLMNTGYQHLYATIPVTKAQVACYVKQFFGFLNVDFISIILDKEDKIAGFGIIMPSLTGAAQKSRGRLFPLGFIHWLWAIKHSKTVDMYLVAVRPELRMTGIPYIMISEMTQAAIRNKLEFAIAAPELETNTAVQSMWRNYDAHIHRRRRVYLKTW
jgi:hypothetical protein